jgi:uncharacterized membrane protein YoaK (UPF0700 family)
VLRNREMATSQTMSASAQKSSTRLDLIVLLLAIAGGGVDAIVILAFQVLTGAQTGNTVMLAVALAQGRIAAGFYSAVSVAAFVVGSIAGQLVLLKRQSESALGRTAWPLVAELVALTALLICWHSVPHPGWRMIAVLVALAATAMGIQSAAVLRLHGTPTTTYVTGTLITFSTELTRCLFGRNAALPTASTRSDANPSNSFLNNARVLYGLDWLVYVCGALSSGALFLHFRELALLLPMFAITSVIIAARARHFHDSA